MTEDPPRLYAVVSGDVVGSTQLGDEKREHLYAVMKRGSEELVEFLHPAVPLPVDIYAGDSWQVLVTDPNKALRAALFYRAYLMAHAPNVDTRAIVAIGTVQFLPPGNRVSEGDGEAFRLSGRLLQDRKRPYLRFVCNDPALTRRWSTVFGLIDTIASHWSDKGALALTGSLRGWSRPEIASLWSPPVTDVNVTKRLERAGWRSLEPALVEFEEPEWLCRGGNP